MGTHQRRWVTVLVIVLVLIANTLPGLVLTLLGHSDAAGVSALAAMAGLLVMLAAGPRIAWPVAALLGPVAALAVASADQPLAAGALMGGVAVLAGLSARRHLSSYVMVVPITLAFVLAQPPRDPSGDLVPALVVGAIAGASALWASAIAWLLERTKSRPSSEPMAWSRVNAFAAVLGVVVGLASALVVALDLGHGGAWFIMTLLVVIQPTVRDAWSKTIQRAGGTVIGFLLALLAYPIADRAVLVYVIAGALLALALISWQVWHRPYWQFVALLTPAIVLFEGASASVVDTAVERLGFTLLGVAVAVAVEAVALPFDRSAKGQTESVAAG